MYGIVKQSSGFIWVYSEEGHGTTFKVYLPQLESPDTATAETRVAETSILGGSETILLVEDEDVVRSLACKILEQSGYTVLETARGDEAIRLAADSAQSIDLLLTDVVMPEVSGKEVADRLTKSRPNVKTGP
ncbi:MAG: response regulator [Acidobacteriota bacterium]